MTNSLVVVDTGPLVYVAERENLDAIFTLDVRDFSVYRTSTGRALRMIPG